MRQYGRTTEWKAARMIARREGGEEIGRASCRERV